MAEPSEIDKQLMSIRLQVERERIKFHNGLLRLSWIIVIVASIVAIAWSVGYLYHSFAGSAFDDTLHALTGLIDAGTKGAEQSLRDNTRGIGG